MWRIFSMQLKDKFCKELSYQRFEQGYQLYSFQWTLVNKVSSGSQTWKRISFSPSVPALKSKLANNFPIVKIIKPILVQNITIEYNYSWKGFHIFDNIFCGFLHWRCKPHQLIGPMDKGNVDHSYNKEKRWLCFWETMLSELLPGRRRMSGWGKSKHKRVTKGSQRGLISFR